MSAPLKEHEFEQAKRALVAGGFTNARAIEILHTRQGLLDLFAAAALTGLLASHANPNATDPYNTESGVFATCEAAFKYGLGMIEARRAHRDHHVLRREPA